MIKYPELQIAPDQYDKLASEVSFNSKKILPPEGYLIGQITDTNNGMLVEFVKNPEELVRECIRKDMLEGVEEEYKNTIESINNLWKNY